MMSYGEPVAYTAVQAGIDVIGSDGQRVGVLGHVLADDSLDVFDGLVIEVQPGPGGHRFVDADQVAEIHEHAVILAITSGEVSHLPEPQPAPAVMESHGVEDSENPLQAKLHRAWDLLSGNY